MERVFVHSGMPQLQENVFVVVGDSGGARSSQCILDGCCDPLSQRAA